MADKEKILTFPIRIKKCPFCKKEHEVEYYGTLLVQRLDGKNPNQYKCKKYNRTFVILETE